MTNALDLDTQAEYGQGISPKTITATYAAAGALADNQVVSFFELPVSALLDSLVLHSDDLGTTGDINIGLYPGRGSTILPADLVVTDAVDEDCLGSAIDVNAAALANIEVRFETQDHNTINSKLWEIAGLSTKPAYGTFILAVTMSEASTGAGDITLKAVFRK